MGARTAESSAHFVMAELEREGVQATEHFVAVYDSDLDTGRIYATEEGDPDVTEAVDGLHEVGGETYGAGELPLDRLVSAEAYSFAWNAFYPESESPA